MTAKKVLLVDDNASSREVLSSALKSAELSITEAYNGKEATKKLEEESFDLIISDEVMPRMSGLDLFSYCRNKNIDIPFILMTGLRLQELSLPPELKDKITVVEKPFQLPELKISIMELLKDS